MYTPITAAERYLLARLRQHHVPMVTIARLLGRHRSTLYREVRRNATHHDGSYRAELADSYAPTRRTHSRRNQRFSPADWAQVYSHLRELWSPEQIAGRFRHERRLRISHEAIYRHIWADKRTGGTLHTYLRGYPKPCRKPYGHYDSRGRLAGKRPIAERPAIIETRGRIGDWEADTILGADPSRHCVLSLFLGLPNGAQISCERRCRRPHNVRKEPRAH